MTPPNRDTQHGDDRLPTTANSSANDASHDSSNASSNAQANRPAAADPSVDTRRSPFYAWLDNTAIRELVQGALDVSAGERMVLIKGLVPGLVDDVGLEAFEAFLDEIRVKARRYAEAVAHPGEGGASRSVESEPLGGPIAHGEAHLPGTRNPRQAGGRALERQREAAFWDRIGGADATGEATDDRESTEATET